MNNKDYKAIAKIIKEDKEYIDSDIYPDLINRLADYFEKENDTVFMNLTFNNMFKFNKEQFLKECGIDKEED